MNRIRASLTCCVLFSVITLQAGFEEDYVWVYSLMQQGERFEKSNRNAEALAAYLDAREQLMEIKRASPSWNPRLVDYRLRSLEDKIIALRPPEAASGKTRATDVAVPPPDGSSSAEALNAQILQLGQELERLRSDNSLLQAKLREALSVRPAAVDPRMLESAEAENRALTKENDVLRSKLAEARSGSNSVASSQALEKLQRELANETERADQLEAGRALLTSQIAGLTARAQVSDALRQENVLLKQQLASAKRIPADAPHPAAEQELTKVMAELALLQNEVEILRLEKSALEARIQTRDDASVTPVVMTTNPRAESRAQIAQLEQERAQLQLQLGQAHQDLELIRTASVGEPNGRVQAEVERLEARLAVYEAEKVPYSSEELVLFRMSRGAEALDADRPMPPSALGPLVAQAEHQFQQGNFEQAEVTLQQALAEDDSNAFILANLAATQIEQGKAAAAERNLEKALASAPRDPFSLATMGILKFQQEEYDEALDYLGQAAQYNPESPVIHNYLGMALSEQGMRGPAETALRRAIQLQPGFSDAHFNLALVYALQEPPLRALARWHYQRALAAGHPRSTEMEQLLDRPATN